MNILVIAPHPDDEALGMGGTIKKLSQRGNKIQLCVVSEGASAEFKDKKMIKVRRDTCVKAGKILGISKIEFLEFPDQRLDSMSQLEINVELEKIIKKFEPKIVYTSSSDLNMDHQKVFESTLVACRPISSSVKTILSYEVPSFVKTQFHPTIYEDITKEMPYKMKAFKIYKSEIRKFPHPRSIESVENLAVHRGIEAGLRRAEGFQLIRSILD